MCYGAVHSSTTGHRRRCVTGERGVHLRRTWRSFNTLRSATNYIVADDRPLQMSATVCWWRQFCANVGGRARERWDACAHPGATHAHLSNWDTRTVFIHVTPTLLLCGDCVGDETFQIWFVLLFMFVDSVGRSWNDFCYLNIVSTLMTFFVYQLALGGRKKFGHFTIAPCWPRFLIEIISF